MSAKKTAMKVDGIEVNVTAEALDDFEITEALADMEDDSLDDGAKMRAAVRFMRTLFGADFRRVKDELRAANGGRLTNERMTAFAGKAIEAAGAKN